VIWAAEELDSLVSALDDLFTWFLGEIKLRARGNFNLAI
jgi:hypothetical protein